MSIPGNVTTFKAGGVGGNTRSFDMTYLDLTSVYEDGMVEVAFDFQGLRYYIELDLGKLLTAALERAMNGGGVR